MLKTRVIPCLLLDRGGLVKTVKFKDAKYVGDPINAVRIFNEKEVDELVFLDIKASQENREPDFQLIADIASQAFMPLGYGGGITSIDHVTKLLSIGIEKVVINTSYHKTPSLIKEASEEAGSQSVVVSIDVKKKWNGKYSTFIDSGKTDMKMDPLEVAKQVEGLGAGEIFLNSIDKDGLQTGYDLQLVNMISSSVSIPVVASGGAGSLSDLKQAVDSGASAVSAGSMFVFYGKHRAVLITYPEYETLVTLLGS